MWLFASDSTNRCGSMPAASSAEATKRGDMVWRVPSSRRPRSTTGLSQLPTTRSAEAINALSRSSTSGVPRFATADMSPMKSRRLASVGGSDMSAALAGREFCLSPRSDGRSRRGSQESW